MNANIGQLNSGKCYVYLWGDKADPFYGTESECESVIAKFGLPDPIPVFVDGVDMTDYLKSVAPSKPLNALTPKASKPIRNWEVTITPVDYVAGMLNEAHSAGTVTGRGRNEAMRKARDILRENVGPYGPRCKVSVKLSR